MVWLAFLGGGEGGRMGEEGEEEGGQEGGREGGGLWWLADGGTESWRPPSLLIKTFESFSLEGSRSAGSCGR